MVQAFVPELSHPKRAPVAHDSCADCRVALRVKIEVVLELCRRAISTIVGDVRRKEA